MQSSFKVSFGRNGAEIITSRMDNVQSTLTFKKYLMRCDTKGLLHKIRTDGIILVWFEDWLIDMEQNRNKLLILSLAVTRISAWPQLFAVCINHLNEGSLKNPSILQMI